MVEEENIAYTGSASGTAHNFITSTASTIVSMIGSHAGEFKVYRCGRCNQPIGKNQKKCYNCGAIPNWEGIC